jgi:hypothetical protein
VRFVEARFCEKALSKQMEELEAADASVDVGD